MSMIVLYTTHCPRCEVLEAKLKEKQISFTINDNIDDMIELDAMSAPILFVDGTILYFKEAIDWVNTQEDVDEN